MEGAESYPADWQDDQTMDVLFSPFRENRDVNPRSWDRKNKFWTDLILQDCKRHKLLVVDAKTLPSHFSRNEKMPVCLNLVLQDMLQHGLLQRLSQFQAGGATGWLSWSMKPAAWAFSTFVKRPLTWGYGRVFSPAEPQSQEPDHFVVVGLVKETALRVLERHHASVQHELTDRMVSYERLRAQCADVCGDGDSLQMALTWLSQQGHCRVAHTEKNEMVILFAARNKKLETNISENDWRIYRLKDAETLLTNQIEELSAEMEKCRVEAKSHLLTNRKALAKNVLKRKKKIEMLRDKKDVSLENISHLLRIIQQVESDKMVLDAYASGNEAFKDMTGRYGLNAQLIDDVMEGVQESLDNQAEIEDALAVSPLDLNVTQDDLELELADIVAAEDARGLPDGLDDALPDALTCMSVADESLDDLFPQVPTFEPGASPRLRQEALPS